MQRNITHTNREQPASNNSARHHCAKHFRLGVHLIFVGNQVCDDSRENRQMVVFGGAVSRILRYVIDANVTQYPMLRQNPCTRQSHCVLCVVIHL